MFWDIGIDVLQNLPEAIVIVSLPEHVLEERGVLGLSEHVGPVRLHGLVYLPADIGNQDGGITCMGLALDTWLGLHRLQD